MKKLDEKLDFNFSYKDVIEADKLFTSYISERKELYKEIISDEYTYKDIQQYLKYFSNLDFEDSDYKEVHPSYKKLCYFLNKNYEVFLMDKVCDVKESILYSLYAQGINEYYSNDTDLMFEDFEFDTISKLEEDWKEFMDLMAQYPLLNLDKMKYENIDGVQVYYDVNTQDYILSEFKSFLNNIKRSFPNTLLRLDTFVLTNPDYLEFVAGEKTFAYFINDSIFYPSNTSLVEDLEKSKKFIKRIFYHEFGHYIEELISFTSWNMWEDYCKKWFDDGTELSRDEMKYDPEDELWADSFSYLFFDDTFETEGCFIHKPSERILDVVRFILEQEFPNIKITKGI